MPLSNPVTMFGVHQVTIQDRSSYNQFSAFIMSDFNAELTQEQMKLQGGSSPYPWDTAPGFAESTIGLTFMQYDLALLKYLAGYNATNANFTEDADGDAAGAFTSLSNKVGTSIANATTGIASATAVSSANPVFGEYLIKATGSAAVDVYLNNNLDGVDYINDSLKITSAPLTITTGAPVTIPNTNTRLTGGSGTIGLTTADIATFSSKPINTYNYEYKGGAPGSSNPEFRLTVFLEKLGSNKYRVLDFPRVKANGISFKSSPKEWASCESEIIALYDSVAGYAWKTQVINV